MRLRQLGAFNYWWLAHAVQARVDAFDRTGDGEWLHLAEATYRRLVQRNHGRLFNDYFDDMSWLALASLRLHAATGTQGYLDDAQELWRHIDGWGFNATFGRSVGWRRQQPDYKNAPTNGSFALVSAGLFRVTGDSAYATTADDLCGWIESRLVDPRTGIVFDGLGRTGDQTVDSDWRFSYNQGLYLGLLVDSAERHHNPGLLKRAVLTAVSTIDLLAPSGVFALETTRPRERRGGDAGLFKGIFFRHLATLVSQLDPADPDARMLAVFLQQNAEDLWQNLSPTLLSGDDWQKPPGRTTYLSTQLSAVITLEAAARLEQEGW
ncbi:glycoside hydrolase family 76 protein [Subtercola frigoramans]